MKYIYLGSPGIARDILQILCDRWQKPVAVVTQTAKTQGRGQKVQATEVESFARERNIPVIATDNVNAPDVMSELAKHAPDLLLVVAFGQIFKEPILQLPKKYCLNVHASLLPKYRGAAPVQRSIWNGDKVTGVTIQKMVKALDAGDMLVQKTIPIDPQDTSATLLQKLGVLGGEALLEAAQLIETGKEKFTPQDPKLVTHAAKIEKTDSPIDWKQPAEKIVNQIRALQPWPVAETTLDGVRLRVFGAEVTVGKGKPGDIATDAKSFLRVRAGDGRAVALTEIQLENRKRLGIADFLTAYRGSFPHATMG